jgi:hypothetical protein
MASKKATKTPAAVQPEAPKAPSAMDMLKAALADRPTATSVPQGGLLASVSDPAIAGATRKGKSGVVKLGMDPKVQEDASEAARIAGEIKALNALFSVRQSAMRDYGAEKRKAYNKIFRTDATTVDVPYTVEVAVDPNSDTPGRETRYVQVVCQNRYSVSAEPVLAGKETVLGGWFDKLFLTNKTKTLRPNAEELFRNILTDNGILGENLDKAMELLFEEKTEVKTVEAFETLEQEAPEAVRTFLSQSVTRVQPSLKFGDY